MKGVIISNDTYYNNNFTKESNIKYYNDFCISGIEIKISGNAFYPFTCK